jgi:hypothetical protein
MEITIYGVTLLGRLIRRRAVRRRLRFARVACARLDWQARILWEVGIGGRELAHHEGRAAVGEYRAGVMAVGAEPGFPIFWRIAHGIRITQSRA